MQRIRLSEKLIRSAQCGPDRKTLLLGDTDVRALHVYVSPSNKTYRFIKQINRKRYHRSLGEVSQLRLSDARRHALRLAEELRQLSPMAMIGEQMTIQLACEQYLVPYYQHFVKDRQHPLGIIKNYLQPQFGHYRIHQLTATQVQRSVYDLMQQGYAAETIRKYMLVGHMLYKQLAKQQLVRNNPFSNLDRPKVANIRSVVLTPEQRLPFINCCLEESSVFSDVLLLQLATGLRVSEAIRIRCEDVAHALSHLVLPQTKAGQPQMTSLNSLAQSIIQRRLALTWNAYLFPSPQLTHTHIASPRDGFLRIKRRMAELGHDIAELTQHDLRRSFASVCAEVTGGDLHMVAQQIRHSSTHILKRYIHYQQPDIKAASEAVAKALLAPTTTQNEE